VSRRHLRVATVVTALTVLSLVAAAPSFAVLGVPIATTTTTGSPMPAFSWTAVNGAVKYEFQITDSAFNPPRYTITTRNTRATLTIAEKDGNWQWRVRGIDSAGNPGPWSDVQSWDKLTPAPEPAAPLNGDVVAYPTPLVFSWNVADGASKYKVKWGDDPTLSAAAIFISRFLITRYVTSCLRRERRISWISRTVRPRYSETISVRFACSC